jgi:hypothetical protein
MATKAEKELLVQPNAQPDFLPWAQITPENIAQHFTNKKITIYKEVNEDRKTHREKITHYIKIVVVKGYLEVKKIISEDKYNRILLEKGWPKYKENSAEILERTEPVAIRFVVGKRFDDSEFYEIEIGFSKTNYIHHFFTDDQVSIIENLQKNHNVQIPWKVRPDKLSEEDSAIKFED